MKGILNHLILPNLQSLAIELHLDATVNHDVSDWELIAAKIQSIKRFEDLGKMELRLQITVDEVLTVDHWVNMEWKSEVIKFCAVVLKKTRITELRISITFFLVPTDRVRFIVFGNGSYRDINRCPLWPTPDRMDAIIDTVTAAHPALQLFEFKISGRTGSVWWDRSQTFARAAYTALPTDGATSGSKPWIEVESNEDGVIDIWEEMKDIAEFAEGEADREWMALRRFVNDAS
ncbi:hypothetical protein QFC20_002723 [Naganishia adeliensis]|uniref:Uncharacterized protein n=1 Tax=Naganishia adeliensis TaxID=92952 RepID=A0ACC2WK81_9TREE|nr:hypothetical protein QFC20_002723 [Naganishia adeliensis]